MPGPGVEAAFVVLPPRWPVSPALGDGFRSAHLGRAPPPPWRRGRDQLTARAGPPRSSLAVRAAGSFWHTAGLSFIPGVAAGPAGSLQAWRGVVASWLEGRSNPGRAGLNPPETVAHLVSDLADRGCWGGASGTFPPHLLPLARDLASPKWERQQWLPAGWRPLESPRATHCRTSRRRLRVSLARLEELPLATLPVRNFARWRAVTRSAISPVAGVVAVRREPSFRTSL